MKTAFETAISSRPAEALITDPRPNLKVINGPANDNIEQADRPQILAARRRRRTRLSNRH